MAMKADERRKKQQGFLLAWKREHGKIRQQLTDMLQKAEAALPSGNEQRLLLMEECAVQLRQIMHEVERHAELEQTELFPAVAGHDGYDIGAVAVLEKEHTLAMEYARGFLQAFQHTETLDNAAMHELITYLQQVHYILLEHFLKVQTQIFPHIEHKTMLSRVRE